MRKLSQLLSSLTPEQACFPRRCLPATAIDNVDSTLRNNKFTRHLSAFSPSLGHDTTSAGRTKGLQPMLRLCTTGKLAAIVARQLRRLWHLQGHAYPCLQPVSPPVACWTRAWGKELLLWALSELQEHTDVVLKLDLHDTKAIGRRSAWHTDIWHQDMCVEAVQMRGRGHFAAIHNVLGPL